MILGGHRGSAMSSGFDRRIVSDELLGVVRSCQTHVQNCHLGGGAALAGVHLAHRHTRDVDLFVHDQLAHREIVRMLPDIAKQANVGIDVVRDGGTFVRARINFPKPIELNLVYEPAADLAPSVVVEGVIVESLVDLRASKLTCLLSRSEPRDLVDLFFLERQGFVVEDDLQLALKKDAGVDPGVLAWLLDQFPVQPLPMMILDLSIDELRAFRSELSNRLRQMALP
jgi:hypothetical protein